MTLARLALPSISRVLEADPSIPRKRSAPAMMSNQPDAPTGQAASTVPSSVPQPHLMKTIDFRDNSLEAEEEELFSFVVGFPNETALDEAETQTIFQERAMPNSALLQGRKIGQAFSTWVKNNFPRLVTAVHKLFPVKVAEIFLLKAGQNLVKP